MRSEPMLTALMAVNEGDIRAVKAENGIFTEIVSQQLAAFGEQVRQRIHAYVPAPDPPLVFDWLCLDWGTFAQQWQARSQGGVLVLPVAKTNPVAENRVGARVAFLPENLLVWGPAEPAVLSHRLLPMADALAILNCHPESPYPLETLDLGTFGQLVNQHGTSASEMMGIGTRPVVQAWVGDVPQEISATLTHSL